MADAGTGSSISDGHPLAVAGSVEVLPSMIPADGGRTRDVTEGSCESPLCMTTSRVADDGTEEGRFGAAAAAVGTLLPMLELLAVAGRSRGVCLLEVRGLLPEGSPRTLLPWLDVRRSAARLIRLLTRSEGVLPDSCPVALPALPDKRPIAAELE